jgi:SAM-dependent methyltransferase
MSEAAKSEDVKKWWADNPMTYGRTHGTPVYGPAEGTAREVEFGSLAFFQQVDETQYRWNLPLHDGDLPFGKMFPYRRYVGANVLEVGCGMGTMAMHWAKQGARITAVDLNPVAVEQTSRRFRLLGLNGRVLQADGRGLPFADSSFAYVYSWGVLHHSDDLDRSITDLLRVLKPGGEFGVMLYNRASIRFKYLVEYIEGYLHGEHRFLTPLQLGSRYADAAREEGNPHTWPVTPDEMHRLFSRFSSSVRVEVFGDKELDQTFTIMMPGIWRILPSFLKRPLARRWGWSLWITGTKDR